MTCECANLPEVFNLEAYPHSFDPDLIWVADKSGGFLTLRKCAGCGQYWQLDLIDKYQTNCAIKIGDPFSWETFDDKPIRMQYLFDSRSGVSDESCIKARLR